MENTNSVAYIAKISKVEEIPNAEKIELATVEGWTSTVQKGIHKVGDLVLCLTTDAVIPDDKATKWGVVNYLRKGNRVRTIKLRGVISECILIPVKDLETRTSLLTEGLDMMSILGIFKYEPPSIVIQGPKGRKYKYHQNSNFHIYYKFPNQKNVPNMFDEEDIVVITRKMHGSNARYGIVKKQKLSILDRVKKLFGNKWIDYEYIYGSHNVEKGSDSQGYYSSDIWREVGDGYEIKSRLWDFVKSQGKDEIGSGLIVYGEIYGEGVQGQHYTYGLTTKQLATFDIEKDGKYLDDISFLNIISILNLPVVETLYIGKWSKERQDQYVGGNIPGTKTPHEGIVVKHINGERSKVSKCINPDYLMFGEKNNIEENGH